MVLVFTLLRALNGLASSAADAGRRRAERDAADLHLRQSGGTLTDRTERLIERTLSARR